MPNFSMKRQFSNNSAALIVVVQEDPCLLAWVQAEPFVQLQTSKFQIWLAAIFVAVIWLFGQYTLMSNAPNTVSVRLAADHQHTQSVRQKRWCPKSLRCCPDSKKLKTSSAPPNYFQTRFFACSCWGIKSLKKYASMFWIEAQAFRTTHRTPGSNGRSTLSHLPCHRLGLWRFSVARKATKLNKPHKHHQREISRIHCLKFSCGYGVKLRHNCLSRAGTVLLCMIGSLVITADPGQCHPKSNFQPFRLLLPLESPSLHRYYSF